MRITGGSYRGRTVQCPPGNLRPAMDRMRESVFAVLGDLEGLSFLDLFSGSGVVGIEAASRGADPVCFVERDRKKTTVLRHNVAFVKEAVRIVTMPAERFIRSGAGSFDLVFLDPPFAYRNKSRLLSLLGGSERVRANGVILIHYPAEDTLPKEVSSLTRTDERRYGRSHVAFYIKSDHGP